jgi:NAD(P)-dependent dehydrogenase (short-subunit alcohol dehydrogenase family)
MNKDLFFEFDLSGKVAPVTGAARGLGQHFAISLARYGADLIICDIREMEKTKDEIEKLGRRVLVQKTDVTKNSEINKMVEESVKTFGHIDILVNNAGTSIPQKAVEVTEEVWDKTLALNLKGVFFCAQAVGKIMVQQRKGKIINIASQAGIIGVPGRAAYGSSKGGVITLTKVLAIEWAEYNINVNAIAPTFTETPLSRPHLEEPGVRDFVLGNIPLGRVGQPQDLVGALIYLSSEASNMVTGHVLLVDGGWTAH